MAEETSNRRPSNAVSVSLRTVAVAAGAVAVASLVALVVVAYVEGADGLATVAIVLAILAFVVQLMVYVAQQNRNEQLYSDMRALLAGLEATAAGTERLLTEQFDKVLKVVLEEATSEAAKDDDLQDDERKFDVDEFERKVMARVEERLRREQPITITRPLAPLFTGYTGGAVSWGDAHESVRGASAPGVFRFSKGDALIRNLADDEEDEDEKD